MERRDFIMLIGGAALARPVAAQAQRVDVRPVTTITCTATDSKGATASTTVAATVGTTASGLITSFTTTPAPAGRFNIDGRSYGVDTAGKTYSITSPDDHTLRFELRTGEFWANGDTSSVNRSEADGGFGTMLPFGSVINLSYKFMLEPGVANTAPWFVVGQFHNDDQGRAATLGLPSVQWTSPPIAMELAGENLSLVIRYCPTNLDPTNPAGNLTNPRLWTAANPIVRGQWYNIRIQANPVNDSTGYIYLWVDGVQVVNYHGPVGYGPWNVYWCFGLYRSALSTTIAANYQNVILTTG